MKKMILETDYVEIIHDSDLNLGKIAWKRKTTLEEYQVAFITMLNYSNENPIKYFLSDIRNQSVVSPESRKWFETEVIPKAIESGYSKAAVLFDGNVFKKHYINMLINVTNKFRVPLKMFNKEEDAIKWFAES